MRGVRGNDKTPRPISTCAVKKRISYGLRRANKSGIAAVQGESCRLQLRPRPDMRRPRDIE